MSVKISGVMKDAMGKPIPDCTIALKALHTTAMVITKTVGSLQPEENGSYSMDVELGKYSVTLCVEGYPPNDVGEIYVHSESVPGTLNYYLGLPTEGDLPPAAIQQFEAMVELVSQQAAQIEKDKAAAAKSAADALASQTAAKTSESNADSSAKVAKASETNAGKSQKAAEQSATQALASQEAAQLSETAASNSQASATKSASEALASQTAAKTSETNAKQSADAADASAKAAKLSETNAKTSETNAGKSAAAALASEKAAKTSETNTAKGIEAAAASAQAAKLSETNAEGSKKAAQASATEALASQGAAKTSETNAGNSAKAASGSADKAKSEADRATAATDGKQDENALLTAIAALNTAADQIITLTGKNSVETAVLTKFAKEMLAKTDAAGVREYLGLEDILKLKADKSALGTASGVNTGYNQGNILLNKQGYNFIDSDIVPKANSVSPGVNIMAKLFDGFYDKLLGTDGPDTGVPVAAQNGTGFSYATCYSLRGTNRTLLFVPYVTSGNSGSLCWRGAFGNNATPLVYTRDSRNTTVDSSGFIKTASPIIKVFSDGSFETNDESEGAQVKRESVGVYRISNILGPHSDKAWGGIDGGFEIPKDRNGQRLLWLDYEVDADGSILVKTYHRTYPEAPEFARNTKDGYEESDPIDIPPDQFLSVRVEMPQDSMWNLAQKAAREEMEQEKAVED